MGGLAGSYHGALDWEACLPIR
jgi:hypothetical protein